MGFARSRVRPLPQIALASSVGLIAEVCAFERRAVASPIQRTAHGQTGAIEHVGAPEPGEGAGQIPRLRDPQGKRSRRGPSQSIMVVLTGVSEQFLRGAVAPAGARAALIP